MRTLLVAVFIFFVAAAASAQNKFSGTQQCAKPDPEYVVPVGDRPDHMMALAKDKCTWSQAEIGGVQLKDEDDTIVSDISATRSRDRGVGVAVLASGDKAGAPPRIYTRLHESRTDKAERYVKDAAAKGLAAAK